MWERHSPELLSLLISSPPPLLCCSRHQIILALFLCYSHLLILVSISLISRQFLPLAHCPFLFNVIVILLVCCWASYIICEFNINERELLIQKLVRIPGQVTAETNQVQDTFGTGPCGQYTGHVQWSWPYLVGNHYSPAPIFVDDGAASASDLRIL